MVVEVGKLEEELVEVFRITLYSNTFLNEMWFLTVDPLVRVSVWIAKLSER